jgi:hypothetical protein
MDTRDDNHEYPISSLDNFAGLAADIREKERSLAESLHSSHLVYEDAVWKAHDFFNGDYEVFLKSYCYHNLQLLELNKIKLKYQLEKCSDLRITAEELHTTTVGRLTDQLKGNPEELKLVLQKKENLKRQVLRKLPQKLKTFKDEWVRA